ncbi:MAG: FAD-binding oxidoreductase [Nocardioidaceae bacterium]
MGSRSARSDAEVTVDGTPVGTVVRPRNTDEVAEQVRKAVAADLSIVVSGATTTLTWGRPPESADLLIDTTAMDTVIHHEAGDLVVKTQAGVLLADLQRQLSDAGQRLALDPVVPGGTIGGTIATGLSGPLRLSHGSVRDLLIGVTFVRADGVVAKAGGTVVKNVAGYDLAKLFCGSWGTLGIVTEAVFRLHPITAAHSWVTLDATDPAAAQRAVDATIHSTLIPAAIEYDRSGAGGPVRISVLLEGIEDGVEARTAALCGLLDDDTSTSGSAPDWWGVLPGEGGTLLRLTHEISALATMLDAVAAGERESGLTCPVRGSAAGVGYAVLPSGSESAAVVGLVDVLRAGADRWGGQVVVLDAPAATKAALDVWGPVRGLDLMRQVKEQFDPDRRLAPGRFAGGI